MNKDQEKRIKELTIEVNDITDKFKNRKIKPKEYLKQIKPIIKELKTYPMDRNTMLMMQQMEKVMVLLRFLK